LICEGKQVVVPGSAGSQLVAEIRPRDDALLEPELLLRGGIQTLAPGEEVIYKPRWGAFYATPLEEHLRSLGIDSLTICGFNFPNCPRASIYEASERDYRLVLAADAITGLYEKGMQELSDIGVRLLDVETIANLLPAG
jgi:nicotinamidase-related amidase